MEFQIPRFSLSHVLITSFTRLIFAGIVWCTGNEWLDKVVEIVRVYKVGGE